MHKMISNPNYSNESEQHKHTHTTHKLSICPLEIYVYIYILKKNSTTCPLPVRMFNYIARIPNGKAVISGLKLQPSNYKISRTLISNKWSAISPGYGKPISESSDLPSSPVCCFLWSSRFKYSSSMVSLRMRSLWITTGWLSCFASLISVSSWFKWYASSIIAIHLCSSFGVLFRHFNRAFRDHEYRIISLYRVFWLFTCTRRWGLWLRGHFRGRKP